MDESKTSVVCATIEYQQYYDSVWNLSQDGIELIRKFLDAKLTDEEMKSVRDKTIEILYRRNDIDWCRVVEIKEV